MKWKHGEWRAGTMRKSTPRLTISLESGHSLSAVGRRNVDELIRIQHLLEKIRAGKAVTAKDMRGVREEVAKRYVVQQLLLRKVRGS